MCPPTKPRFVAPVDNGSPQTPIATPSVSLPHQGGREGGRGGLHSPPHRQLERETIRAERAERQLEAERQRVEDSRKRIDELQRRIDGLHTDLADARTAAMISGSEAAALRAENALLKARPWWRKWFR